MLNVVCKQELRNPQAEEKIVVEVAVHTTHPSSPENVRKFSFESDYL